MACSDTYQCFAEKILCKEKSIKFRSQGTLKEIFEDFIDKDFDPEKSKRKMITHEPQFRKICQNLKLHLGSDNIETNIFKGVKAVSKRDFEKELKSGNINIFVPKVFLSKFSHVYEYDAFIKKIDELKVIQDINELKVKIESERDLGKKERMCQKLQENEEKMRNNEFYKELRKLSNDEIQMVKSLQVLHDLDFDRKKLHILLEVFRSIRYSYAG